MVLKKRISVNTTCLTDKQNKNNYLISVIIPCYNVENYIEKCFSSLLNQSIAFNKLEIIFVDDCSTDNTFKKIKYYEKNYLNVYGFQTSKNSGYPGQPRNIGLNHATSDFIMFLDPDDTFYENACEILLEKINETNADFVSGLHSVLNSNNELIKIHPNLIIDSFTNPNDSDEKREKDANIFLKNFSKDMIISDIEDFPYILSNFNLSTKIFNLEFIKMNKINFPEHVAAQDSFFIFKSMLCSNKFIFINSLIYIYNRNRNKSDNKSISYERSQNLKLGKLEVYKLMYEESKDKNKVEIFVKYLLKTKMKYYFYNYILDTYHSKDELIELFESSKELIELLHIYEVKYEEMLSNIISEIVSNNYNKAIHLCNEFVQMKRK